MYEIIKHAAKQTTTLFTSPCESMARARFNKSAGLLKLNETLELLHEGKVIDSVSKKVQRDEDGEIIFPETSSKLEHTMKSLYCIAGSLPAQFRSSQVDCGIGWKEHAKKEPRKAKTENGMPEIKEQLKEATKLNTTLGASIQASAAAIMAELHKFESLVPEEQPKTGISIKAEIEAKVEAAKKKLAIADAFGFVNGVTDFQPPVDQPLVWIGIDPAAESNSPIDLSTVKAGDKVMLVDGETFKYSWARDFTKNKVYEVCEVDMEDTEGMQIRLIDDVGDPVWVFTADVRAVCSNVSKGEL